MAKKVYKDVYETIDSNIIWELDTNIHNAIAYLKQIVETNKNIYHSLSLYVDTEHDYDGERTVIRLRGTRKETDKERDKRLFKAGVERDNKRKLKAINAEKERKEYERLKKKFG